MNRSMATLKERLSNWRDWDEASYEVGVCLGFWPDFGAPIGEDQWNGVKGIIWSNDPLGNAISNFLLELVKSGMLEYRNDNEFRWNPDYKDLD